MSIGNKIAEIRKSKNITQQQLAEKIYVTQKTISSWEVGRTLPSVEDLISISETLNLKLDDLIDSKEIQKEYKLDNKKNKILKVFYLIILLLVPAIFFNYEHYNGYCSIMAKFNTFKDFSVSDIPGVYHTAIFGSIYYYIIYSIIQIFNYFIYLKKNTKTLIIVTIIELVILFILNLKDFDEIFALLLIVAPLTNLFLYFIKKMEK